MQMNVDDGRRKGSQGPQISKFVVLRIQFLAQKRLFC